MAGPREGDQLAGRYLLIKSLNSGGSAVVWQALDQQDGLEVALKIRDKHSLGELSAEYDTLNSLSHPAIVTARNLVSSGELAILVLDIHDGDELGQYMGADYRIWLPLLRPVIAALHYAHGRGVVHGDLKLENILVTADSGACLIDFGPRPGQVADDDIRAMAIVMTELATGLPDSDDRIAGVPTALDQLIRDMRGDSESMDFAEVAARIDEVLNKRMSPADSEQFERIEPVARHGREHRQPKQVATDSGLAWSWIIAAGLIVVAAILVAVFWQRLVPGDGEVVTPDSTASTDSVDEARARLEDMAARTQLESSAVYKKWLTLEAMDVSTWAELRAARALELLQEGERLASELDYVAALRVLAQSNELFSTLLDQAPDIAVDRREAGWLAYRRGDAETAATHFRVALAIDPDQDEVRAALRRTAYLEQLTTLTREARVAEENGDLDAALAALDRAFLIDSDNEEVEREIERLKAAKESAGFQRVVSGIYSAIGRKDYKTARNLLRQAISQRPDAAEVRDAATQLNLAERAAATASLRARATEAEESEDWEGAIELYSELLAIDPALVLAQQGRDRSRRLATLTARAERLLATPLISNKAREQVETLLEQIDSVATPAPNLNKLAAQLEQSLRLSRLPVKVQLQSDNLTEIMVQRVARLGAFERHELELMPGQYTIVGTRAGYRDVRTELVVEAGKPPTPLVIRCEEQI